MALSPDDFATAFRALAARSCSVRDLQKALKLQSTLWEKNTRKTLAQILVDEKFVSALPPSAGPLNLKSDPAAVQALGEMLLRTEMANEHELDKLVDSFAVRPDPKSLPGLAVPPSLNAFDVEWEIGRSRLGVVYRSRMPAERRDVALKIFRAEAFPSESDRKAFIERAAATKGDPDPGFVRLVDAGESDGFAWAAMEFIEGPTLATLLAERRVSLRRGLEIVERAARTIGTRHAKGGAHGSLSASAILIGGDDRPHVAECGWIPGGSAAQDVFALGVMLYEIAAGNPPFGGFRPEELKPPSHFNPQAAGAPDRIIIKALARDASRRYPNATELADDLGRHLRHEEVKADVTAAEAAPESAVAKKASMAPKLVAAALILILASTGLWALFRKSNEGVVTKPENSPAPSGGGTAFAPTSSPKPKKPPTPRNDPKREEIARKGPMNRTDEKDIRFKGVSAMASRDFAKLEELADEALIRGPERPWAHHWMAMAAQDRGDSNEALLHANRALEMGEEGPEIVQLRFDLLMGRAEYRKALADVEKLYPKGVSQINDEIRVLGEQIKANSKDASLYMMRGALFHHRKHYANAVADFQVASSLGDYKAHYFRGLSLAEDERKPEAAEAIRLFLSTQGAMPGAEEARLALAELAEK